MTFEWLGIIIWVFCEGTCAIVIYKHCTYHMEEITGTLLYIYRNCSMLGIDPSGWKRSVQYGLGADISLPPCLATGIWNLVPKATSGPKSRGASLGTKLWRHVQRYCAQFLAFMVIYDNSVLCVFCLRNRKYPRISNGNRNQLKIW